MSPLRHVFLCDPTVHRILAAGGTLEDCIVALFSEKKALRHRLEKLEIIAPKKIKLSDGRVMVWHCPDELIPVVGES